MIRQPMKAWAIAAAFALTPAAWAEIPSASGQCSDGFTEATPSSEFTVVGDGSIVRHEATGLEWQRCAVGQSWDGSTCQGSADTMTWQEALKTADQRSGWRLPNINKLRSIVETCRTFPSINQQVFPNTPADPFWSASPFAGYSDSAWHVRFAYGNDDWDDRGNRRKVRLVREGQ